MDAKHTFDTKWKLQCENPIPANCYRAWKYIESIQFDWMRMRTDRVFACALRTLVRHSSCWPTTAEGWKFSMHSSYPSPPPIGNSPLTALAEPLKTRQTPLLQRHRDILLRVKLLATSGGFAKGLCACALDLDDLARSCLFRFEKGINRWGNENETLGVLWAISLCFMIRRILNFKFWIWCVTALFVSSRLFGSKIR